MSRYVDADALIKIGLQDGAYEYVSVDEIANFPTADVVPKDKYDRLLISATKLPEAVRVYQIADLTEVVRCRDCKHRFVDGENVRFNRCELNHNKVQGDDWFCADGERREDG